MTKIVYNGCFGGFGLSDAAMRRYAEIKGVTLFVEEQHGIQTYWTVPDDQRQAVLEGNAWFSATNEQRAASNAFYEANTISDGAFVRTDEVPVQVIEELGDVANGMCAKLRITDLPKGTLYRIDTYDGSETVATNDSYEWAVA